MSASRFLRSLNPNSRPEFQISKWRIKHLKIFMKMSTSRFLGSLNPNLRWKFKIYPNASSGFVIDSAIYIESYIDSYIVKFLSQIWIQQSQKLCGTHLIWNLQSKIPTRFISELYWLLQERRILKIFYF